MTKKKKIIIIILVAAIIAAGGILFAHFYRNGLLKDIFSGELSGFAADELLLGTEKIKAPEAAQLLFLDEEDMTFDAENEKTAEKLESIDKELFSGIVLKSKSLKKSKISGAKKEKLLNFTSQLKALGFKVYLEVGLGLPIDETASLCAKADGIFIADAEKKDVTDLNSELLKIKAALLLVSAEAESYVKLPLSYDFAKLNKKSIDGVYLEMTSPSDGEKVKSWDKSMKIAAVDVVVGFNFSEATVCDMPLKAYYEIRECESVKARAFGGYEYIRENKDNSFGALREYISAGIIPELALRAIAIEGYNGETLQTGEFSGEVEVYGSNLFPCYLDGKKIDLGEIGRKKVPLTYKEGENTFNFVQGSNKTAYKINLDFTGELIRSVSPTGEITAYPGENLTVMVVAYSKAKVTVKLGAQSFEAEAYDEAATGYTVFAADIRMPETKLEIDSLGMLTVVATYADKSSQLKGAMIKSGAEASLVPGGETTNFSLPAIENYVPTLPEDAYGENQVVTVPATQNTTSPSYVPFTGAQMCVVTASYADTRPLIDGDDTFVPYYAPLVAGTVDYVIAESEAYNSEDEEMVYFYELASGRKVKRSDVQLIPREDIGQNSMSVLSCTGDGKGTLKVTVSTNRKIPYDINYTPQDYFSAYKKQYNVSSFTATQVVLTFYHTTSVSGTVDVSGSNVVSAAQWSVVGGNAVLTLTLSQPGKYYGCSVEYDTSGNLILTVHNNPGSLAGAVILLDPGHGGKEPGAVGYGGAVKEKDVNYAIAYYTKLALEKRGATVYLTRGDDTLTLEQRKEITRSLKPDLFISIHNNGSEYPERMGTSTYYYKPFSQPLAKNIYDCLLSTYKSDIYAGQTSIFGDISDGTIYYPFSVTRIEDCPSVLLEVGYMTNDRECYELIQTENQLLFAEAIAEGVDRTLN